MAMTRAELSLMFYAIIVNSRICVPNDIKNLGYVATLLVYLERHFATPTAVPSAF